MESEPLPPSSAEPSRTPELFGESAPGGRSSGRRYSDEVLRQNLERYRELFERIHDIVYSADADGHFTLFNPAALHLLQYSAEELLGRHYSTLIHSDYRHAVTRFYLRQFARRVPHTTYQYPALCKDGRTIWFEQNVHLRIEDGEVKGFLAIARDITQQKKFEQLRNVRHAVTQLLTQDYEMDEFFSRTLQIVGEGLGWQVGAYWEVEYKPDAPPLLHCRTTWKLDQDRSSAFEATSQERVFQPGIGLPGQTLEAAKPLWLVDICVDPFLYIRADFAMQDGLHGGFAFPVITNGVVSGVFEFFTREKQEPDEDQLVTATTIGHQIGQVLARKLALNEVRRSEARKTGILESALDAIVGMDHTGRVTEWNPAAERIFGYRREDALGRDMGDLIIPPDLRPLHHAGIQNFLKTRKGVILNKRLELSALRANGEEFPVELIVTLVSGEEMPAFTGFIRDISERKQSEAKLLQAREEAEAANRAKSEFLSRMSHELRTPLNGILGFAQVLQMDQLSDDHAEMVGHIETAGNQLLNLINEVLDISAIDSGHISMSLEPVSLWEVVSGSLDLIAPLAARRSIFIHRPAFAEQGDRHVVADRQRLGQVLLNLLSNAVKYNREGGQIIVECEPKNDEWIRLSVTDKGDGLTQEKIEHLFQPFNRLGAERTAIEGTGLGLALTKRLTEAMNGEIGVESEPGEGATFWIELPATQPVIPMTSSTEEILSEDSSIGGTVLYIEDNLANLKLIEHLLQKRKRVRLLVAMQGGIGFDLARQHRPDLILLDQNLPDTTGYEVLKKLQADARTRDLPVVMLSADATQRQIDQCLAAGAADYLTKPIDVVRLLNLVDGSLHSTDSASAV